MTAAKLVDLVPPSVRAEWKKAGFYSNQSLYQRFAQLARRHPDRQAVCSPEGSLSYEELWDKTRRLAAALRESGLVEGDVLAYQLPNGWQCCALDLAAAALGVVSCPLPVGRGRMDLESLLRRCRPRCVVLSGNPSCDTCEWVENLNWDVVGPTLILSGAQRDGWVDLNQCWDYTPIEDADLPLVNPDGPARFLVSSGTESEPKLVAYSHNALMGGRGRFLESLHANPEPPRSFYLIPLASAFGSSATAGVLCWLGGTLILTHRFDPAAVIDLTAVYSAHYLLGVPTMFQRLLADPALTSGAIKSLKAVISGGALVDESTVRKCRSALGCDFISLYGSADGVNCHHRRGESLDKIIHTVGRPNPTVCEIRILDEAGQVCPSNVPGQIVARGPLSPMQYVNAPELDRLYRDADGWVRTGDVGCLDEQGYLVLKGRIKDTIIRGGQNISPTQIEAEICAYPGVISAACVGVADEDLGQRVGLCVSMALGAPRPRLSELNHHLELRGLERHKLPDYLRYYRHLPLNPAGKVDKKQLAIDLGCIAHFPQATVQRAAALITSKDDAGAVAAPALLEV